MSSADGRPVLRLYGWHPPALSLGWFQPVEPFVQLARSAGLALVRRPTGGGAIHHDQELTFCIVASPGQDGYPASITEAYAWAHDAVAAAVGCLGPVPSLRGGDAPLSVAPRSAGLCFAETTAFDLVDERGRKLVGSAQRRRDGRVLHHGSLPLVASALSPDSASWSELAGRPVPWSEAAEIVAASFASRVQVPWSAPEAAHAEELATAERLAPSLLLA